MKVLVKFSSVFLLVMMVSSSQSSGNIIVVDHMITNLIETNYCFVKRNTGVNKATAFKTIQNAIDNADEGDTIVIRQGIYKEAIVIDKNRITLKSFDNEKAVIDGNNPRFGRPLVTIQASEVKIIGLVVMHSSRYGIYSIDNHNILVKNCEVAYSEDGGIVFVNGSNVIIEHCIVHHNNYRGLEAGHEGITLRGVKHFEVRHCEVFDNKEEGIDAKYGAAYGKIHHNHVYRNNGPNIYIDIASNIEIYNNVVHDAISKSGISINIESTWRPESLAWTLHNIKVYNNLIYNNSGGIGFWLEPGKGSEENAHWDSISIVNNTLVNNSKPDAKRGGGIYISNGEPHNFGNNILIKNNIICERTNGVSKSIWDYTGNVLPKFNVAHNALLKSEPTDATGKNPVLVSDMHFINPHRHDYRISNRSPAINAGDNSDAPLFDLDDRLRRGNRISLGAYELMQSFSD